MRGGIHSCPNCRKKVSDNIPKCPHCGADQEKPVKQKTRWGSALSLGCLLVIVVFVIFPMMIAIVMPHRVRNRSNPSSPTTNPKSSEQLIGQWVDDQTTNPGNIKIIRTGKDIVMLKTFKDGTEGRYELSEIKVDGQTRYYSKGSEEDRYCYIDSKGDLAWVSDGTVWMIALSKKRWAVSVAEKRSAAPQKAPTKKTDPKSGREIEAYTVAQILIEKRLKAPDSAKWPGIFSDYNIKDHTQYLGNGTYLIDGYVDSQNGFGAMIRTNFICKLKYKDNKDWSLIDLNMQ